MTFVFLLLRFIPGDPAEFILGDYATKESLARLREELGLTKPVYVQYLIFMKNAFQGDLGRSLITKQPALREVLRVYPHSLVLAGAGVFLAILVGIPLGVLSALKHNTWLDYTAMSFALFGVAMPVFWLGIMAILLFAYYFQLFPATGLGDVHSSLDLLHHLILPATTLGLASAAYIARLTRSSMLEVIRQDYIRTAQAKGVAESVIIFKHALKNALIPVIALVGLTFGWALGSSILIESVFSRSGVGLLLIKAIFHRDYPLVQAGVAVLGFSFVMINVIVDILFAVFDPRIRYSKI